MRPDVKAHLHADTVPERADAKPSPYGHGKTHINFNQKGEKK
jgi:hypothetical protein